MACITSRVTAQLSWGPPCCGSVTRGCHPDARRHRCERPYLVTDVRHFHEEGQPREELAGAFPRCRQRSRERGDAPLVDRGDRASPRAASPSVLRGWEPTTVPQCRPLSDPLGRTGPHGPTPAPATAAARHAERRLAGAVDLTAVPQRLERVRADLDYDVEIRQAICTTKAIESLHSQPRTREGARRRGGSGVPRPPTSPSTQRVPTPGSGRWPPNPGHPRRPCLAVRRPPPGSAPEPCGLRRAAPPRGPDRRRREPRRPAR